MILTTLILSLATIIAAVCANSVVIRDLGHGGKIKSSIIIAAVGMLLHVLIGNVVTTRLTSIAVWVLMIYPRKVNFSLL
jgi:Na+(H+)/acetate symporter ActP